MDYISNGITFIRVDPNRFEYQQKEIKDMISSGEKVGVQILIPNAAFPAADYLEGIPANIWGLHLGNTFKRYELHNVISRFKRLAFLNLSDDKTPLNLSEFSNLKTYIGPWSAHFTLPFPQLENLSVEFHAAAENFIPIAGTLNELKVIHLKKGNYENLNFLKTTVLEEVDIYNNKYLRNADALLLCPNLKTAVFEKCPVLKLATGLKVARILAD